MTASSPKTPTHARAQTVIVVGAGLNGLAASLACHHLGIDVTLVDAGPLSGRPDPRASFLNPSSLRFLTRLGVTPPAQTVTHIQTGEGHPGEPVRGRPLSFDGADVDGTLGAIVENDALRAALLDALGTSGVETHASTPITDFQTTSGQAVLSTADGDLTADLIIAADGRSSMLRRLYGISTERHDYARAALTFTIAHTGDHTATATQFFYPNGPLALLPLTGQRSSVVWTDVPAAISVAKALTPDALMAELTRRIGPMLGDITLDSTPLSYPLHQLLADTVIGDRLALVGDAAHLIHPLAGQGLNLGLRDAAAIADIVSEAKSLGRDIGGPALGDYARWRAGDIRGMALATDALSHAYALPGPLGSARRAVTDVIGSSGLSSLITAEAVGERPNLPALMR